MRSHGLVGLAAFAFATVAMPWSSGAQAPAAKKAPAAAPKAEAPAQSRPGLNALKQDLERKKAEVAKLEAALSPGEGEIAKHREAKATLTETLAEHENRIKESEPRIPAWTKERSELQALPKRTKAQNARIEELGVVIGEAQRIVTEAKADAARIRGEIRKVDGEIAKIDDRRITARRDVDAARRAVKDAAEAVEREERRAAGHLALYDVLLQARLYDATMKTPKPPYDAAAYEAATAKKQKDQLEQEKKAVENGKYALDTAGLKKALQTDGAKFFSTARAAAGKKPLGTAGTKATPARTAAVKDIEAAQKQWTQALAAPAPEASSLAPLVARVQRTVWDIK